MNEEQAKQALNERLRGMRCQTPVETMAILNIIWQAACEWKDSQVLRTTEEDPCPACRPNTVCRTPSCGRLKGKRQEPIAPPTAQINHHLVEALELAETEMRYAGWDFPVLDNLGRVEAYKAIIAALAATQMRGDA